MQDQNGPKTPTKVGSAQSYVQEFMTEPKQRPRQTLYKMDFNDFKSKKYSIKPERRMPYNMCIEQLERDKRIVKLCLDDKTNPFKDVFDKHQTTAVQQFCGRTAKQKEPVIVQETNKQFYEKMLKKFSVSKTNDLAKTSSYLQKHSQRPLFNKTPAYNDDFQDWKCPGKHVEGAPKGVNPEYLHEVKFRGETKYKKDCERAKSAMRARKQQEKDISLQKVLEQQLNVLKIDKAKESDQASRNSKMTMGEFRTLQEKSQKSNSRAKSSVGPRRKSFHGNDVNAIPSTLLVKYQEPPLSLTLTTSIASPIAGPSMREPSSPNQRKAVNIDLNFNRLSPRAKTPLMRMLAERKEMKANNFVSRRLSEVANNPSKLQAERIEKHYSTTCKMDTDLFILNAQAGASKHMQVFRPEEQGNSFSSSLKKRSSSVDPRAAFLKANYNGHPTMTKIKDMIDNELEVFPIGHRIIREPKFTTIAKDFYKSSYKRQYK